MEKPVIAKKEPKMLRLEPGTYFWCSCGKSSNQPFCDGSHQGSAFTPLLFNVDKKQDYWLCQCKHSGNKPFCDGQHRDI